jgi:hypothetical protein
MTCNGANTDGADSNAQGDSDESNLPGSPDTNTPPAIIIGWTCPKCDTDIELHRDVCWNCLYNPNAC